MGLSSDARDEVRAAGRAIQLLIDEIDLLHVDLWNLRATAGADRAPAPLAEEDAAADADAAIGHGSPAFDRALRWRLAGFRQRRSPAE